MAFSKYFEQELDKVFHQRTHWLRNEICSRKVGKPPKFGRKKVNKAIERLQQIASDALARNLAKIEFNRFVSKKRVTKSRDTVQKIKKLNLKNGFTHTSQIPRDCFMPFGGRMVSVFMLGVLVHMEADHHLTLKSIGSRLLRERQFFLSAPKVIYLNLNV